jgi:hypothetical protein
MDIADVKRKARTAASKRRAEAHELLKDMAGVAMAERGLPAGLGPEPGSSRASFPTRARSPPFP